MSARVLDLVDRLRGIYTLAVNDGAGLLNGKDTITREFFVPPIHREAADEIERLRAEVAEAMSLLNALTGVLCNDAVTEIPALYERAVELVERHNRIRLGLEVPVPPVKPQPVVPKETARCPTWCGTVKRVELGTPWWADDHGNLYSSEECAGAGACRSRS